jgi:uncharacterized protein YraI
MIYDIVSGTLDMDLTCTRGWVFTRWLEIRKMNQYLYVNKEIVIKVRV